MRDSILTVLILAVTLLGGCALMHVYVDSISAQNAEMKRRYVLLSGLKNINPDDPQFKEFACYVEKALALKGFIKANDFEDAELAIFLTYGIEGQENLITYLLPVWGQTGISSSFSHGSITTSGDITTYSGWTTYIPSYGITGYIPIVKTHETYFRFLIIDAVDLEEYKRSQKIVSVWRTIVTSTGSSNDLRRVFPVLIGASKSYIGADTKKKIKVTIREKAAPVREIKEGCK